MHCALCGRIGMKPIQIADTKYIAYGAGPAANKRLSHVDYAKTADYAKFKRSS